MSVPGPVAVAPAPAISPAVAAHLPYSLPRILMDQGNRLTVPGSEVLSLQVSITRGGSTSPATVTLTTGPQVLVQIGGATLGSDGSTFWNASGSLAQEDSDLLETLTDDRIDHLLTSIAGHASFSYPGSWVRSAPGGVLSNPPVYYEIYSLFENAAQQGSTPQRTRTYYVNSATGLLDRVVYRAGTNGSTGVISTVFSGWQVISGQQMPSQIVRLQNGSPVLTIAINSTGFGPLSTAPVFAKP